MVIRRNDGDSDAAFIARLGESKAQALPAEGFVCSVLSTGSRPRTLAALAWWKSIRLCRARKPPPHKAFPRIPTLRK